MVEYSLTSDMVEEILNALKIISTKKVGNLLFDNDCL